MLRSFIVLVVTVVVTVTVALAADLTASDPEHVKPDRRKRPTTVTQEVRVPLQISGADPQATGQLIDDWHRFVAGVQERERAEAEARRLAEIAAEEARQAELRSRVPAPPTVAPRTAPATGGNCAGFPSWFPQYIIWRESNCTRGINTGNGYYGAYQVAGFHWNGGICSGLTWTIPAQEDECTWRLSAGGSNLAPWGV